jgi:hypothetical protein
LATEARKFPYLISRDITPRAASDAFDGVTAALTHVPDLGSAFSKDDSVATFDQLFLAHYGHWVLPPAHFELTAVECAALDYLYPEVRRRFEDGHGRLEEEYWATQFPAGAVLTRRKRWDGEFWAIVDWEQDDAKFVELTHQLDALEVGTHYLPEGAGRWRTLRLIFDAYSSAVDAMETRRRRPSDQTIELGLVKDQVNLANKHFRAVAQRYAVGESLRGMTPALYTLAWALLVVDLFLRLSALERPSASVPGPIMWSFAGAVGACVSVFVRIASDKFTPTWEATRQQLWVSGALRPLIGAALGVVIPLFVIGGLASGAPTSSDDVKSTAFYVALAFASGFSERWAPDLVAKQPSVLGTKDDTSGAGSEKKDKENESGSS